MNGIDFVDATGAHRRIQALMTQDWSLPSITARLGHNVEYILRRKRIHASAAEDVAFLYNQLRNQLGPVRPVRYYAAKRMYLPVHAWDHAYIDDPRLAAEYEALTVWLDVAPDPAVAGGPMEHLFARVDTLLPWERGDLGDRAHTLRLQGDDRPVVIQCDQLWQRDRRRTRRQQGRSAA